MADTHWTYFLMQDLYMKGARMTKSWISVYFSVQKILGSQASDFRTPFVHKSRRREVQRWPSGLFRGGICSSKSRSWILHCSVLAPYGVNFYNQLDPALAEWELYCIYTEVCNWFLLHCSACLCRLHQAQYTRRRACAYSHPAAGRTLYRWAATHALSKILGKIPFTILVMGRYFITHPFLVKTHWILLFTTCFSTRPYKRWPPMQWQLFGEGGGVEMHSLMPKRNQDCMRPCCT